VKRENDRDRAVERLLQQSSADSLGSARQGECIDAEVAAAWVDGNLLPHELRAVESHVSACARCQAIVATLARTTPADPSAPAWWQRSLRWGWLVPLTASAAAVVLWIVTPNQTLPPTGEMRDAVAPAATQALKQEPATVADRFEQEAPSNEERVAVPPAPSQARERPAPGTGRTDELDPLGRVSAGADRAKADQRAAAPAAEGNMAAVEALGAREAAPSAPPMARAGTAAIEIVSPDSAIRWRLGEPGVVQYSADGGKTWDAQTTGTTVILMAGASPSPSVCWLVGRAGTILLTTDGRRWPRVPFPEPVDLVAVQAVDAQTATVSTGDGRRFRTTDGGTTWVLVPLQEF
jgi:hypothetical protein